jgi:predicted amidophosphoribosyltransferase
VIAFLAAAVIGSATSFVPLSRLTAGSELDLPCPWCHAQTAEDDAVCPACGKAFTSR